MHSHKLSEAWVVQKRAHLQVGTTTVQLKRKLRALTRWRKDPIKTNASVIFLFYFFPIRKILKSSWCTAVSIRTEPQNTKNAIFRF